MYTSCPECGTVFRITTQELRVAEGYARCGHCSATFNAVAMLTDDVPPTITVAQLAPEALPELPVGPSGAEPELELEEGPTGEHIVLESTPRSGPAIEDHLEFDVPEDNWSNFFEAPASAPTRLALGSSPGVAPQTPAIEPAAPPPVRPTLPEPPPDTEAGVYRALTESAVQATRDDGEWQALLAEVEAWEPEDPVYVLGEEGTAEAPVPPRSPTVTRSLSPEAAESQSGSFFDVTETALPATARTAVDEPLLPGPVAAETADPDEPEPWDSPGSEPRLADQPFIWGPPQPPEEPRRHWGWLAGSLLLALLAVLQLAHFERDNLATVPRLAEPLKRLYGALGMPLYPAWNLGSYELRGSEAVAGRTNPGALEILARIAVVGNEPAGLPLVRVTLRDRLARELGSRVFEPADYLGQNSLPREPVDPGTVIPVELTLRDPGVDAYGFDVDVCLISRRDGITCRAERQPFVR